MLKQGHVVALDSTANLLKRFTGLQVMLRINAPLPEAMYPRLLDGKGVADERLRLRVASYDEAAQVLADLRAADIGIDEVEIQRADLEDVFLQVMAQPARAATHAGGEQR